MDVLSSGGRIDRETRAFDAANNRTVRLRSKEELLDYRFFPDPDLPVLSVSDAAIAAVRRDLPELPESIAQRWVHTYGLTPIDTAIIVADPDTTRFFEAMVTCPVDAAAHSSAHSSAQSAVSASTSVSTSASSASASSTSASSPSTPRRDPKKCAAWLVSELFGRLNAVDVPFRDTPVSAMQLASIVDMIDEGIISGAVFVRVKEGAEEEKKNE